MKKIMFFVLSVVFLSCEPSSTDDSSCESIITSNYNTVIKLGQVYEGEKSPENCKAYKTEIDNFLSKTEGCESSISTDLRKIKEGLNCED